MSIRKYPQYTDTCASEPRLGQSAAHTHAHTNWSTGHANPTQKHTDVNTDAKQIMHCFFHSTPHLGRRARPHFARSVPINCSLSLAGTTTRAGAAHLLRVRQFDHFIFSFDFARPFVRTVGLLQHAHDVEPSKRWRVKWSRLAVLNHPVANCRNNACTTCRGQSRGSCTWRLRNRSTQAAAVGVASAR